MEQAIRVLQAVAESFRLWRKNAGAFTQIYLLLYTPLAALGIPFALTAQSLSAPSAAAVLKFILLAVIIYVFTLWANIVLILVAAEGQSGKVPEPFKLLKGAWKHFWPFLWAGILYALVLLGVGIVAAIACAVVGAAMGLVNKTLQGPVGLAANIVGIILLVTSAVAGVCYGVYFAIRLSLGWYACVLENIGPLAGLKRSLSLVKKRVNAVIGVGLFIIASGLLIYTLPAALLNQVAKTPAQATIMSGVWQYLAGVVFVPVFICVPVILLQKLKEVNE